MQTNVNGKLLPWSVIIVMSLALFSAHFGVGDILFPAKLGREAGQSWLMAALGYGIINSLGVMVAYLAIARRQKTLLEISSGTLGKSFGIAVTTCCILINGPAFILPRVASASHEMVIATFFPGVPLWATLLVFFVLNAYLAYNRSQVIDRMGKFLSPMLIIFMFMLIIKGVIAPIAGLPAYASKNPLSDGVLAGYNTMNALGAALFGGWILSEFSRRNITDKNGQAKNLIAIGSIVSLALLITSSGLTYLGASTGAALDESRIGLLTMAISQTLLGTAGNAIFAVILVSACITTSVGLTSTAGDVFEEMTNEKLKYGTIVIASSVVGFCLGLVGLSRIVDYTVPWLMLVYPAVLVLVLGNLFGKYEKIRIAVAAAIITSVVFSIGYFLEGMGFDRNAISALVNQLPLGTQGLGWLVPSIVVFALAQLATPFFVKKT